MLELYSSSIIDKQNVQFIMDDSENLNGFQESLHKEYNQIFILYDQELKNIKSKILNRMKNHKRIVEIPLKAIESIKSLKSVSYIIDKFEKNNCSKSDAILSIGGGTVLDISGFVASIYMRGIDLIMIPTTLMGQADACSAGKTCVNGNQNKNLMGSLYMPKYVYNNVRFLETTSKHSMRQGLSEIFKYGLLGSRKLLKLLNEYSHDQKDNENLISILKETIKVRIRLRKIDPLISNLGHTFGHALESESKNKVAHGDAISVGILLSLKLSLQRRKIKKDLFDKIIYIMNKLKLNMNIDESVNLEKMVNFMMKDKKSNGKEIGFVLLKDIGVTDKTLNKKFLFLNKKYVKNFLENIFSKDDILVKNHWKKLIKSSS